MSMINEQFLFKNVISRLFTGRVEEMLGELLQNSLRAGADSVYLSFPQAGKVVIEDNGHGLDDLHKVLVFAESFYLDGRVKENQAPMGVGLYALIAHEEVSRVTVESGSLAFTLETQRWINDPQYRETWEERVNEVQGGIVSGVRLTIEGSEGLMEAIRQSCIRRPSINDLIRAENFADTYNPVSGYAEMMAVFLEGSRISELLPRKLSLPNAEIKATYQGNEVRISMATDYFSGLVVNWYGQVIFDHKLRKGFCAHLAVREGQPVIPQAPTRTALMQNALLEELYQWIEDQIFDWVCAQSSPSPWMVKQLYQINQERAECTCPFVVLRKWKPLVSTYLFESFTDYAYPYRLEEDRGQETDQLGAEMVFYKHDLDTILLLDDKVICPLRGDHPAQPYEVKRKVEQDPARAEEIFPVSFEIGLNSFLSVLGESAYKGIVGTEPERITSLWWKPGPMQDKYHTTKLGEWTLRPASLTDHPLEWKPLMADQVFVANETEGWDCKRVQWIIGLITSERMISFLKACGWAPFMIDEDHEEESQASYGDSLDELIISYLKDTIERGITLLHLPQVVQHYLPQGYDGNHANWSYIRHPDNEKVLEGIRLSFPDGYTKDLQFYRG